MIIELAVDYRMDRSITVMEWLISSGSKIVDFKAAATEGYGSASGKQSSFHEA